MGRAGDSVKREVLTHFVLAEKYNGKGRPVADGFSAVQAF